MLIDRMRLAGRGTRRFMAVGATALLVLGAGSARAAIVETISVENA